MATYFFRTRKDQVGASWQREGMWILGSRPDRHLVKVQLFSPDGGQSYEGTYAYEDGQEGMVKAKLKYGNVYSVLLRPDDDDESLAQPEDEWILGAEESQPFMALDLSVIPGRSGLAGVLVYGGASPMIAESSLAPALAS